MSRIHIKKEALCLLYCYLNFQRRLCYQKADNYRDSWSEGLIFYQNKHQESLRKVMVKLENLHMDRCQNGHIDIGCIDVFKHKIMQCALIYCKISRSQFFHEYWCIDQRILMKVYYVFANTDKIFATDQRCSFIYYMMQNSRRAGYLMSIIDVFSNCELEIKNFSHMEDISFSKKPSASINELMILNFKKTEDDILCEQWLYEKEK